MLPLIADVADLADRNISTPDGVNADAVLRSVSDAIRDAAGCAITQATSTITLVVGDWCEFDLPAGPVSAVSAVTVGGIAVTGWQKIGDTVYMPSMWTRTLPVEVTVAYTHGYPIVPADIVDLACGMASIAFSGAADSGSGYGQDARVAYVRLGDFGEGYKESAGTDSPSPIAVPDRVREQLRARFGVSATAVAVR